MDMEELDELEDDEDERILLEYRQKRMAEMREHAKAARFGELINITGEKISFAAGQGSNAILLWRGSKRASCRCRL